MSTKKRPVNLSSWSDLWHNMRRTPYQALTAILTLTLTFYVGTIMALFATSADEVIQYLEAKPQVTAFFAGAPTDQELAAVKMQLENTGFVREIVYISQEEALEIYKQQNQDDPLLLEMVNASILPASIEVLTYQPEQLDAIADLLTNNELVDDLIYQQDVISEFVKWTTSLRGIGMEFLVSLGILSFLQIFIVMGNKVSIKRREIKIMQLVGATPGFIRRPFLLESVVYALIGGLLGWGAVYTRILYATPFLLDLFSFIGGMPDTLSWQWMLSILGLELLIGIVGAWIAAWLSVQRYLR